MEPDKVVQGLLAVIIVCVVIITVCASVYFVSRYRWLKRYMDNQLDMIERVQMTCATVDYNGSIPVVAVERFMHYIKHPDPGFGPTAILRHERDNQKTKIGSAKE